MSASIAIKPAILQGLLRHGPSSFNAVEKSGALFSENLWREFIQALIAHGISLDRDMYGVSWPADELTPPQYVYYFCGFESETPIEGLTELRLEGGNYFEFKCEVPADNLDLVFTEAYMRAMPESGLKERDGQHLEIYGEDYDPEADIARFKILIPVE